MDEVVFNKEALSRVLECYKNKTSKISGLVEWLKGFQDSQQVVIKLSYF